MRKRTDTTAIARYDEDLAAQAAAAAEQEKHTGGGQFFSMRGARLTFNDAPLPGNRMAVVVIDCILENTFYTGDFDPDAPTSPTCYAFGRDEETTTPHEDAPEPQHESCHGCQHNQFGSSDRGRGKACRNRRRLAVVSAGTIDKDGSLTLIEDPDEFERGQVGYLALPPTALKGWGAYVKQLAATLKRPPHAVITEIAVEPDDKNQIRVLFELVKPVNDELLPACLRLNRSQRDVIEFPYQQIEAQPRPSKSAPRKRKY